MAQFATVREAKEYLIGRIVAQADGDGTALSDVERKMLYFSETGWTLPDMMTVSHKFDESYDQDDYEKKIAGIVRRIHEEQPDDPSWDDAVHCLAEEDHYLLVLIGAASDVPAKPSRGDRVKLVLAGVVVVAVVLPISFFVDSHVANHYLAECVFAVLFLGAAVGATKLFSRRARRG